jgi:hypothetical protein
MALYAGRLSGGRGDTRTLLAFGLPLGIIAGCLAAVQPKLVVGLVGSILALFLAFTLPESILLGAFMFVTLSGFRPFPPVFGFHIQAQYFLLLPMLLRSLITPLAMSPQVSARWRLLIRSALAVVGASLIAFGLDLTKPGVLTSAGDYTAWLMAFVFLVVLVRLAWSRGADFAHTLYTYLLDIIGVFSAFTLFTSLTHLRAISDASATRLSFADLDPNETGVIVVAGLLLAITPLAAGQIRWRHLMWLPFLIPLLVLTGSRDSLGAFAFGLLIPLLQIPGRRGRDGGSRSTLWYLWGLVAVVATVLIVVTADQSLIPASLKRAHFYPEVAPYRHIFGVTLPESLAERVYIQISAFHQFLQHPLLGLGFKQDLSIPESTSSAVWWGPVINLPVAHSAYLTTAAQEGILGLASFLYLVVGAIRVTGTAVRQAARSSRELATAIGIRATVFSVLYTTFNLDSLYQDFKVLILFFWLLVVAALLCGRDTPAT